jgi:rRNA maturation protein Rpf1
VIEVLITTGKKPDSKARLIARALSLSIPGSRLEGRGARTLSSLVSKAAHLHFNRLCAIYKEEGKPHSLSFMEVEGKNQWKWLSPRISITKISIAPKGKAKLQQSACLAISGTKAAALSSLISPANSSDETESKISASAKKITIAVANKKLLELGVKYE